MSTLPKPAHPVLIPSLHSLASSTETKVRIAGRYVSSQKISAQAKSLPISNPSNLFLLKTERMKKRLLSYESQTQLILLQDDTNNACLIDVSLLLDDLPTLPSLRETKSIIMVVGYAEISHVRCLKFLFLKIQTSGPSLRS